MKINKTLSIGLNGLKGKKLNFSKKKKRGRMMRKKRNEKKREQKD